MSGIRIDIRKDILRGPEAKFIALNFLGNPALEGTGLAADVQCYDPILKLDIGSTAGQQVQALAPANYNQYDWLFSGWVDFWAWRARLAGKQVVLRDPDIVKSLAWHESRVGNLTEAQRADGQTLLNFSSYSLQAALRGRPVGPDGSPLQGNQRRQVLNRYDLTWGLFDLTNRTDAVQEVAAVVRWLYAAFYASTGSRNVRTDFEAIWRDALQSYGPKAGDSQYVACYGDLIWELATTGRRPRGCDSQGYWYVWGPTP